MFVFFDDKFNDGSQFEKYIGVCLLETLKKYAPDPNEYIEKDFKYKDYVFDYYLKNLPKDFGNSIWNINNKNVYLEVKKNLTPSIFNRIRRVANDDIYIVIVCMNRVASKYSESNKNILILDGSFVIKLIEEYPYDSLKFDVIKSLEKTDKNYSYSDMFLDDDKIIKESKDNKNSIKKAINDGKQLVLILGNGVSIDYGASSWGKLVDTIADYLSPYYTKNVAQLLSYLGNNVMSSAEVAVQSIDTSKYNNILHSMLYGKYEESMIKKDTYLSAIAKVINKYPNCIVATYNYDMFLEMILSKRYSIDCVSPFSGGSDKTVIGKRKIYHLHGIMPYAPKSAKHVGKGIVLTQSDYYKTYGNNTWCSRKQKEWIKSDSIILFLGSSMTDIYQMSLVKKYQHKNVYAIIPQNSLNDDNKSLIYKYYATLGVNVIIAKDFDDLPRKLKIIL